MMRRAGYRATPELALWRLLSVTCLCMQDVKEPKLPKWPFLLSDLLLVAAAGCIYYRSILPLGVWPCAAIVLCVGAGAFVAILPFVLEYNIAARLLEAQT